MRFVPMLLALTLAPLGQARADDALADKARADALKLKPQAQLVKPSAESVELQRKLQAPPGSRTATASPRSGKAVECERLADGELIWNSDGKQPDRESTRNGPSRKASQAQRTAALQRQQESLRLGCTSLD
ncbi:hypothetical protein [Chitinimonas koreensis]|uniref:hypothetical protein n=1 Tax=Chitinimonas koreensis TaxID=356302 RepID=UPI000405CD3E|nr:hypothetical protein [Chitinimonas koreensis]QNM97318.1 hypothetical protein H9L41_03100 [Chitinimonas koreensis]